MKVGEVVTTKSIKVVIQDGDGWLNYVAPKGKAFVFVVLGVEDISHDGQKLDAHAVFKAMGWMKTPT